MSLNTYLTFNGNCAAALDFYAKAVGAKIEMSYPYRGSPMGEQVSANWQDKIMHARFTVYGAALMASDHMEGCPPEGYKGFSLSLNIDNAEEAERVFHALSENGQITMPIQETFWAVRFGSLTDQFGVPWMVNCERPAA